MNTAAYIRPTTSVGKFLFLLITLFIYHSSAYAEAVNDQDTIDFTELSEYAALAKASYLTTPDIQQLSQSQGYALTRHSNIDSIQVSYFLLTDDEEKSQVIAVRGTSNVENAMVDIAFKLLWDEQAGIYLHNGFSHAASAIYSQVRDELKPGYSISTTGHSLGGAVAQVLAVYLVNDGFDVRKVITFGQPKVTNISGSKKFQRLNHIRVVTPKDLVPLVPPFDLVEMNDPDIYWHSGKEVILLPEKDYAILSGIDSMLRATRFTQQPLDESNLRYHEMSRYISLLEQKRQNARQVNYETSYNLFNLFGETGNRQQ